MCLGAQPLSSCQEQWQCCYWQKDTGAPGEGGGEGRQEAHPSGGGAISPAATFPGNAQHLVTGPQTPGTRQQAMSTGEPPAAQVSRGPGQGWPGTWRWQQDHTSECQLRLQATMEAAQGAPPNPVAPGHRVSRDLSTSELVSKSSSPSAWQQGCLPLTVRPAAPGHQVHGR